MQIKLKLDATTCPLELRKLRKIDSKYQVLVSK